MRIGFAHGVDSVPAAAEDDDLAPERDRVRVHEHARERRDSQDGAGKRIDATHRVTGEEVEAGVERASGACATGDGSDPTRCTEAVAESKT